MVRRVLDLELSKIDDLLRSIPLLFALTLLLAACQGTGAANTTSTTATDTTTTSTTSGVSTTESSDSTTTTRQVPGTTTTTLSLDLGEELVFNGDFSDGTESPDGWELVSEDSGQTVDQVTESGESHISFFSPLEEEVPWPEARSTVPFDVEPHTDYRLSVEARSVTQGRLFLALVFLDEDGDEILLRGPGSPEISESDWKTIDAILESPVDAASAYVVMRLAVRPDLSDADSFSVDVNSVSIREVVG